MQKIASSGMVGETDLGKLERLILAKLERLILAKEGAVATSCFCHGTAPTTDKLCQEKRCKSKK